MPIYQCSKCGCIENTASGRYWSQVYLLKEKALCSECDPKVKKWHGRFEKISAKGMAIGEDGFLYDSESPPSHTKLIGFIE